MIVKAAGPTLAREVSTFIMSDGDVKTTKGYNLQAKHVLHVSLPHYGSKKEKVYNDILLNFNFNII